MKKILIATFLIILSSVFVTAQISDKRTEKVENETIIENKVETDKKEVAKIEVKTDKKEIAQSEIEVDKNKLIEDEKVEDEIKNLEVKTSEPFEKKTFMSRQNTDSYRKNEFFVGYSYQNVDLDFERDGLKGINASYVRNFSRYFGVKADVSAVYRSETFNSTFFDTNNNPVNFRSKFKQVKYNFLGGIQLKDNASENRLRPFAHALIGVGVNRISSTSNCQNSSSCPSFLDFKQTTTNLAGAFGGGLDIKINDKFDFRAIQFDYNPQLVDRAVTRNFRFGIGIVIK